MQPIWFMTWLLLTLPLLFLTTCFSAASSWLPLLFFYVCSHHHHRLLLFSSFFLSSCRFFFPFCWHFVDLKNVQAQARLRKKNNKIIEKMPAKETNINCCCCRCRRRLLRFVDDAAAPAATFTAAATLKTQQQHEHEFLQYLQHNRRTLHAEKILDFVPNKF